MPNHPTAPVFEACVGPIPTNCDALKLKYGVKSRQHSSGCSDGVHQSHHILQDKAMVNLISKFKGFAVLLTGGSGGEHCAANQSQIARNCANGAAGGAGPKTYGELTKTAKEDLEKGLESRIPQPDRSKVAACLVAEAEEHTNKKRKEDGEKPLAANTPVAPVKGCFPAGTLIWLTGEQRISVEDLVEGMDIDAASRRQAIARVEKCAGPLVEITLGDNRLSVAPYHRIRLRSQAFIRADALLPGHVVDTALGPMIVEETRLISEIHTLYSFMLPQRDACQIGAVGLSVDVAQNSVAVARHARVFPFESVANF